ncbi:hypothetical protein MJO28_005988 [Puccinia striiformis f. sp. tritici]|uniref:Uncharacterized protein n=1 Tax=Puccinia striiformis f. sp. tritici TaxID=168172 RepID=A0ACC0EJ46_9BASI|nr:hypothetical protein MJO28_005988 [Puccinia striiformis f. sp. tritici]
MEGLIDPAFLMEYIPPHDPPSAKSRSPTPPPPATMTRSKRTTAKPKKNPVQPIKPAPIKSTSPIEKQDPEPKDDSKNTKNDDSKTAKKDDSKTTKKDDSKKKAKSKSKAKEEEDDDSTTRHIWTIPEQTTFLEQMAEANANGQGTDNGNLKKEAWTALSVKMKAKHGFTPTSAQIKTQKTALRRIFLDVKFLRDQSGFGWDDDLAIVTADDDVWKELLEAHPRREFGKMKDKPFPMYDLAYSVFNGKSATRDLAEQEMVPTTTQAVKLTATSKRKATKTNISDSGSDSEIEVEPASSAQTATTNTTKRVRMPKNNVIKSKMEGINGAIHSVSQKADGLIGAFNMIASAISHNRQPTENTPALHSNPAVSVLEEALNVCAKRFLDQVSDETYANFISVLESEKKARTFLVMSSNTNNNIVLKWLKNHTQKE